MLRKDFIKLVEGLGLPYKEANVQMLRNKDYDGIYVYGKEAYELVMKHPRKYKDLFVPYIRVSHFDGGFGEPMYIRDNGICGNINDKDLVFRLYELYTEKVEV